jgi:hypothetical protein
MSFPPRAVFSQLPVIFGSAWRETIGTYSPSQGIPIFECTAHRMKALPQYYSCTLTCQNNYYGGSSVAAWLSETVLRGRGPGASGFESHRRRRIFSEEGTSAGPWMCVYVFQGLTVGWWKEERHSSDTTARSAGFKSQAGWASHGCCVVFVLCCPEKEKRGWAWVTGESTSEPRRI